MKHPPGSSLRSSPSKCALLAVLVLTGCGPQKPFAELALLVREPQLPKPRFTTEFVNLFFALDGDKKPREVTFEPGVAPKTVPFELGHARRTLTTSLSTGPLANPTAIGRADAVELLSVDDPDVGDQQSATAPVLLAHPNASEPLDAQLPTGRSGSAACDDHAGRAWIVGGVDENNTPQNGYTFKLDSLKANVAFVLQLDGSGVACDGDEAGGVIALGVQPGQSTSTAVFDASAVASGPDPVALEALYQHPFVQVETLRASTVAWIASDAAIQLRDVVDPEHPRIALASVAVPEQSRFLALDTQHLLRFGSTETELYTVHAAELDPVPITSTLAPSDVLAIDVDDHALLVRGAGGVINLVEPTVIDQGHIGLKVVRSQLVLAAQPALSSTAEFSLLRDGRVAVFARDPTTAVASVAIEKAGGLATLHATNREHMAITVGGALLLFGGDPGHDVLIAPDP